MWGPPRFPYPRAIHHVTLCRNAPEFLVGGPTWALSTRGMLEVL